MKKSILFVAVASIFALASCGGEKAAETTTVDTTAAVVETDTATAPVEGDSMTTAPAEGDSLAK